MIYSAHTRPWFSDPQRQSVFVLETQFMLFCPVCNACSETAEPDDYRIGLELTALMGEMVGSDAYGHFISFLRRVPSLPVVVNRHMDLFIRF